MGAALLALHGGVFAAGAGAAVVARPCGRAALRAAAPRARCRRMKTVRRLLYRDIVVVGGLRRAGLPVAVLLHRLRRRTATTSAAAAARVWHAALARLLRAAGPLVRTAADRGADRHHLLAGAPGADRRSSPSCAPAAWARARAARCWPCWAWPSALLTFVVGDYVAPGQRARRRVLLKARAQRRPAARRRRRLAEGAAQHRPRASAATRSTSAAPTADGTLERHPHLRVRRRRPPAVAHRGRARAASAPTATWTLTDARRHALAAGAQRGARPVQRRAALPTLAWPSTLDAGVVAAAVLPLSTMTTARTVALQRAPRATRSRPRSATRSSSGRRRCTRWPAW